MCGVLFLSLLYCIYSFFFLLTKSTVSWRGSLGVGSRAEIRCWCSSRSRSARLRTTAFSVSGFRAGFSSRLGWVIAAISLRSRPRWRNGKHRRSVCKHARPRFHGSTVPRANTLLVFNEIDLPGCLAQNSNGLGLFALTKNIFDSNRVETRTRNDPIQRLPCEQIVVNTSNDSNLNPPSGTLQTIQCWAYNIEHLRQLELEPSIWNISDNSTLNLLYWTPQTVWTWIHYLERYRLLELEPTIRNVLSNSIVDLLF